MSYENIKLDLTSKNLHKDQKCEIEMRKAWAVQKMWIKKSN